MEVNSTIKTKNGTYKFKGELSQDEMDVVVSVGLNALLEAGALPFISTEDEHTLVSNLKAKGEFDD